MKLTRADAGKIGGTVTSEEFKNPLKVEAGRKGGMATLERHGRDQLAEWGKLGGRPRALTHDEIRQQQLLEQNNNKEVITDPPGSLTELKRLHKLRRGSNGIFETPQAGIAQNTPSEQSLPERERV